MGQYFVKREIVPSFENGTTPKLLYICDAAPEHTKLPRTMHKHDNMIEIVFIKEGCGQQLIGDRQYTVRKGDILIYNSSVLHDEYANSETPMSVYCCGIANVKLKGLPLNHLVSKDAPYVLHTEDEQFANLEALLGMMVSQIKEDKPGGEEICNYLLSALITLILQIPQEESCIEKSKDYLLSNQIKDYMDKHYLETVTLESIAKALSISSYYMVHIFKEATGFSPIQYIIRRRIGEAQSLLINTDYSVTHIAGMVGYENTNYFTTLFSKTVGIPPKKYRQLWIKGEG
ncbi:AraC family transcriptional regulator [Metabacillus bambusae]|uniref:Helix-turn-helix transcriptional regulator n=1 Tax=Metabacillus bambusae TaxID=2795218 RepID=A0ABS3N4R6_9BACI|nr:helix-turn-helix domain-containing protein [Metabacillus bambusae]MBO1513301.1 helix-turn-helix transcriptional regulator [Metabacillus bambusae]